MILAATRDAARLFLQLGTALAATLVLGTALLGPLATHFADDLARLLHQRGDNGRPATLSISRFAVSGAAQVRAGGQPRVPTFAGLPTS